MRLARVAIAMGTMNEIDEKVELFGRKLRAQAELYRGLISLAREQIDQISAESVDKLVLFLEKKKRIIDEVEQIEMTVDPLRQFWEERKDEVGSRVGVSVGC